MTPTHLDRWGGMVGGMIANRKQAVCARPSDLWPYTHFRDKATFVRKFAPGSIALSDLYEKQLEQGFGPVRGQYVCPDDLSDADVKTFIERNVEESTCDYCGRSDDHPIAADVNAVFELLADGFEFEWGDPNDEGVPWEQGWVGDVLFTDDMLASSDDPFAGDGIREQFVQSFSDRQWCQRHYWELPRHKALMSGWQEFTDVVLHKQRFLFLKALRREWPEIGPGEIEPADMLDVIGKVVKDVGHTRVVPTGTAFYRARCHDPSPIPADAKELGPPPDNKAQTNRMSPAGISLFSGALDKATAIGEVASVPDNAHHPLVTVGEFRTGREFAVIDLTDLPTVPGLFDPEQRENRPAIWFLRHFVDDLCKPIRRDGREHVEYVPTQVVAEYFRVAYSDEEGKSVSGMFFPSSQVAGGVNCALFFNQGAYCDKSPGWADDPQKWLALETYTTQPNPAYAKTK